MTVVVTTTCDYCNRPRSVEGDNHFEGTDNWRKWARTMGEGIPTGWWPVPGKGTDGGVGHACPACMSTDEVWDDVSKRRQEETERLSGVKVSQ